MPSAVEYKEIERATEDCFQTEDFLFNGDGVNPQEFIRKSAIQHDIQKELDRLDASIATSKERVDKLTEQISKNMRTPEAELRKIHELENTIISTVISNARRGTRIGRSL